jgi:uncharacterized protein
MIKRVGMAAGAVLALFAGAQTAAQAPATAPADHIASDAVSPAMWRIADADSEFILLGTFHILPPSLEWRTDAINTAIAEAQTVYFEVEADADDAQAKTLNVLMTQGFNAPGTTLSGMLDDADTQRLKTITKELGVPYSYIDPMRPWQAFLTLSVQFIIKQGFKPGSGADSVLLTESRTLGKDIRFFETLEEQLNLFTSLDLETEKSLLVLTIRDWDNQKKSFDDLFNAWKTGDANFINVQMNDMMREEAPEVFDRLIVKRNQAWAEEIADAMSGGPGKALVAVGVGHLVGDEYSVPALLKEKGFEVSRYGLENAPAQIPANDNASAKDDIGELLEEVSEEG